MLHVQFLLFIDDIELDLRLARFEHLMGRRLLLLNSVLLRQNPHNVHEWHKRVVLLEDSPHEASFSYAACTECRCRTAATSLLRHYLFREIDRIFRVFAYYTYKTNNFD
jgi:hypothetical protein